MLSKLWHLIQDIAEAEGATPLRETLAWGQPSLKASKGTALRLAETKAGDAALLVHCATTVMAEAQMRPSDLRFDGNRGILLDPTAPLPTADLAPVIRRALTYHESR